MKKKKKRGRKAAGTKKTPRAGNHNASSGRNAP